MVDHSRQERLALADLMSTLGPDAPTLCGDWTTRDLAAHLVVRDRRPDALPGVIVPGLRGWTERLRRDATRRDWPRLLDQLREGGPLWTPLGNPLADRVFNIVEFFVHHEDVRRAQPKWGPRILPTDLEDALWNRIGGMALTIRRRTPTPLTVTATRARQHVIKSGEPMVVVSGTPSELVLFLSGRQKVARVRITGPDDAVTTLTEAPFGI